MRKCFLVLSCIIVTLSGFSQSTLWGIGQQGIFEYNQVTDEFNDKYFFPGTGSEGTGPYEKMVLGSNGLLYYTMSFGGFNNMGTVNVYDPINNTNTVIVHFNGLNGKNPYHSLVEGSNNKLYGATTQGGANDYGSIFEIDMSTNTFTKLEDGTSQIRYLDGDLIIDNDTIIGTMSNGLFEYSIVTDNLTALCPNGINPINLSNPVYWNGGNGLVIGSNGKYYAHVIDIYNSYRYTCILEYDRTTDMVSVKSHLPLSASSQYTTRGYLEYASDGFMYGYVGADYNLGRLIKYDYINDIYSVINYFNGAPAPGHQSTPIDIGDDFLYGIFVTSGSTAYIHKRGIYGANFGVEAWVPFTGNSSITTPRAKLVEVTVPPIISSQPNIVNSCQGIDTSIALVAYGVNLTYQWFKNGISIPETDSIIDFVNPTPADNGYYHCEITNANGMTVSDSGLVTINPLPNVIANATPSVLCEGDSLLLVGSGADTYVWDNGAVNGIPFLPTMSNTYTLTGTDQNGCVNTATAVMPINTIDVSFIDDEVYCGGVLNSIITGTGVNYNYIWTPSTDLSCTDCGSPIASPNVVTEYHLTVIDNNNCQDNDSILVNILASPVDICVVTVDETSTKNELVWEKPVSEAIDSFRVYRDVVGTYTHVASVAYEELSEYTDTDLGINPNATQYRYKISSIDTCGVESPLSPFHQTIHLDAPNFVGSTAELEWQAYDGFPNNYYYRILRDSLSNNDWEVIDSVASSNLAYTDLDLPSTINSTRYLIEIAFNGSCTSTKTNSYGETRSNRQTVAGGSTFIDELPGINSLLMFPNPAKENVWISFNTAATQNITLELMTLDGKLIKTQNISGNGEVKTQIDLSNVSKATYLLRIRTNEGSLMKRLVKQ